LYPKPSTFDAFLHPDPAASEFTLHFKFKWGKWIIYPSEELSDYMTERIKKTTPHKMMKSDQPEDKQPRKETSGDRLVYFAAERTLLSWIRVSLGFMALGFVVDRFDLFLRKMMVHSIPDLPNYPITSWIGIMLVLVGVVANVAAAIKYIRFEIRYQRKADTRPGRGLMLGVYLAVTASVLGILLIFFLILTLQ
jgi:putative membrane protein